MRKGFGLLSLLLCLLLVSVVQADEGFTVELAQIDTANYPEITLYVSVRDGAGEIVAGLSEEMFEITEDDVPVELIAFEAGTHMAISTVLTVDRSNSMKVENKLTGAKSASMTFVDLMREQDQAALVAFDNVVETVQPFTSDKAVLQSKIDSLRTGECTAWYDGVYESVNLVDSLEGFFCIILLSDGIDCREDFWYRLSGNGSSHTLDEAISRAEEAGIPVYAIGFGQKTTEEVSNEGFDERKLRQVAVETGGEYFHAPSSEELEALYQSLSFEMQNEYVLTYRSPRPTYDGTRRDIAVTIQQGEGGTTVTTEGRYLEQHLVNIHSDPTVFLLFLMPLMLLLVMPSAGSKISRWRGQKSSLQAPSQSYTSSSQTPNGFASGPYQAQPVPQPPPSAPFGQVEHRRDPSWSSTAGQPLARLVARFPLFAQGVTLGRASTNQIVLNEPSVAPQHARIMQQGNHYVIQDLGGGQTFVSFNGNQAQERAISQNALKDGSTIRLGNMRGTIRFSPNGTSAYIEIVFPMQASVMTIGSQTNNDIVLNGPAVPQRAEIRYESGRFVAYGGGVGETLLVSFSGNPQQERALQGSNALKTGSTLRIGNVVLTLM